MVTNKSLRDLQTRKELHQNWLHCSSHLKRFHQYFNSPGAANEGWWKLAIKMTSLMILVIHVFCLDKSSRTKRINELVKFLSSWVSLLLSTIWRMLQICTQGKRKIITTYYILVSMRLARDLMNPMNKNTNCRLCTLRL